MPSPAALGHLLRAVCCAIIAAHGGERTISVEPPIGVNGVRCPFAADGLPKTGRADRAQVLRQPDGTAVFPELDESAYSTVFDFGCGCGRLARQLIQQNPRPRRYIGVDRHRGMVQWCQENLSPHAPGFRFEHHSVHHPVLNPDGTPGHLPLPAGTGDITLFIAWSVFTHLLEQDAEFYLRELARVLAPDSIAVTTWFLFDKGDLPMMQEFQNALLINAIDPTNAVIFDRTWLLRQLSEAGLVATRITPPSIRGFQWTMHLQRQARGRVTAPMPADLAPPGIARPPIS